MKEKKLYCFKFSLQVNGQEMTGMTQAEAVGILRNTKLGNMVSIVVSRQVLDEDPAKPKNPVPPETPEVCHVKILH